MAKQIAEKFKRRYRRGGYEIFSHLMQRGQAPVFRKDLEEGGSDAEGGGALTAAREVLHDGRRVQEKEPGPV